MPEMSRKSGKKVGNTENARKSQIMTGTVENPSKS